MSEKPDAMEYGRALTGLTINLLVSDIAASLHFQRQVLGAEVLYSDVEFAALQGFGASWMLHADSTYSRHPLRVAVEELPARGGGVELRLHHCDPDAAEAAARALDYTVLDSAADKPHGVREVFLIDPDGYVWVPDCPLSG
jgi:catechol 2,3-dioxygenase-like lactoylglutathione lyase family enzyme